MKKFYVEPDDNSEVNKFEIMGDIFSEVNDVSVLCYTEDLLKILNQINFEQYEDFCFNASDDYMVYVSVDSENCLYIEDATGENGDIKTQASSIIFVMVDEEEYDEDEDLECEVLYIFPECDMDCKNCDLED